MIQLHQLTIDWLKLRRENRLVLAQALQTGDLALVNPVPFLAAEPGQYGYPVSAGIEEELIEKISEGDVRSDEFASMAQQVDVLEAHRRALLTSRQRRSHRLAHLAEAVTQQARYDQRLAQLLINTYQAAPA